MSSKNYGDMLRKRQSSHYNDLWNNHYNNLVEYKKENGNCYVYRSDGDATLAGWVHVQRKERRLYDQGKHSQMTEERIKLLDAIGFDWNPSQSGGVTKMRQADRDKLWHDTFEMLCDYKKEHGHCNPKKGYPKLGAWTSRQRQLYAKNKSGEETTLTDEKIAKLESIGFKFTNN